MRIFYFFQELSTPMFRWQRTHFIDELSRHGCDFICFNPLEYNSAEEANVQAIQLIKNTHVDLFFTNVCYEKALFPETIDLIRQSGIPTLCLRCDNLVIPYNDYKLAPLFDLVWLTSAETKYLYDRWGARSFYAPYAANPYSFFFTPPSVIDRKICFAGTPYGSRSRMINSLTNSQLPVALYYGNLKDEGSKGSENDIVSTIQTPSRISVLSHRLLFPQGRKLLYGAFVNKLLPNHCVKESEYLYRFNTVAPEQLSSIYSKYVLALASTSTNHTDVLRNPLKIINLRNFEIPMSGGVEFCRFNAELADFFEDNKEIVFYYDNEDLIDKANYYLNHASDSSILSIKRAARKRAEGEHTWWHRFNKAFEILGVTLK